ncbi:hypothetical protein BDV24DRAFT_149438 [Aspergillus arachidicola]|uniref:Amino acid permease/ SLC12A domain-containing protein n=1 Tax=Aspergillus arachidicola TaxID=656916 RepID=A0A5N6YEH1_9EURO|nr:hypothetical protein BDV24DRAFT_149438 [Aspergillus arachidicola]
MLDAKNSLPAEPQLKPELEKTRDMGDMLHPSTSLNDGSRMETQEARNGQFYRSFSPRQVHIISLGSNIGSGVSIATGQALASGGPGNMVLAYGMVCSAVWAVLQSLSEMAIAFPVSGNYIDYADLWVDPALAFGAAWSTIVASEAGFFNVLVLYWAEGSLPLGATVTIFLAVCLSVFLLPNRAFAWFKYITSLIKIFLFLFIIVLSLALVLGAGPNGYMHHGETWTDRPAFLNGFSGFANCALLATWAVGDQVCIGIMGGEAESPRFSMAHATKLVPFRVNFIYMFSIVFIAILVPSSDDRLLSGSGVAASPFVIAVQDAGIPVVPSILNAGMICGVLAISAEGVYLPSRVLRTMAHQRLIPEVLAKVDSRGRPRWALVITSVFSVIISYIQLASGGVTHVFFTNWGIVAFTNWRFHCALKAQKDKLFSETYGWKSTFWSSAPAWLMLASLMLLVCCMSSNYSRLLPNGLTFTAENILQYTLGLWVIAGCTLAYRVIFRTPWSDPKTADCITGRRTLGAEEIMVLDRYYEQPRWRRFLTYVQLW